MGGIRWTLNSGDKKLTACGTATSRSVNSLQTKVYALLAKLKEIKLQNLSKVVVFSNSWLLVQFLSNSRSPPPQDAPMINECSQILNTTDSKILWCPREFVLATDQLASAVRSSATSNYWGGSFPSWIIDLNVFDNTFLVD